MQQPLTQADVCNLQPGDMVSETLDIVAGSDFTKLKANAKWSPWYRVVEVAGRVRRDLQGRAFVGYVRESGVGAHLTDSLKAGQVHRRIKKG